MANKRSKKATPSPASHQLILDALRQACGTEVYLLARLADPGLRLGNDGSAHVFIPDLHIVPDSQARKWPAMVITPDRRPLLESLIDRLRRLSREMAGLTVWQLGDLVDLWRIDPVSANWQRKTDLAKRDWLQIIESLDPEGPLATRRLYGNHDEDMRANLQIHPYQMVPEDPGECASNDMHVTHGHFFDPIESWSQALKRTLMRAGVERVGSTLANDVMHGAKPNWTPPVDYSYDPPSPPDPKRKDAFLCPALDPSNPVPEDQARFNVRLLEGYYRPDLDPLLNRPQEKFDYPALWELAEVRAQADAKCGYAVSLVVVAHTHQPRIILRDGPDGEKLALMDCGSWVGPKFLGGSLTKAVFAAQVGVRVGNDLRIYQLGAEEYKWPYT